MFPTFRCLTSVGERVCIRFFSNYQRGSWALFLLFLLSLSLRVFWFWDELPNTYYTDENNYIYSSLRFGTGDFNPHEFINPAFFRYLLFFLYGVYFLIGKLLGLFRSPSDFILQYLRNPTFFYIIGRLFSVIVGSSSTLIFYLLAREIFGDKRWAYLSAFFFSLSPLLIKYAHFATVETLLILGIISSFYFLIKSVASKNKKFYFWATFVGGISIGVKYSAIFLAVPIFFSLFYLTENKKAFLRLLLLGGFTGFLGFFFSSPYCILDLKTFIKDVGAQIKAMRIGYWGWEEVNNTFWYQLSVNLKKGLGLFMEILGVMGLALTWLKREKKIFLVSLFCAVFYFWLGKNVLRYERFILPLIPFFSLLSIYFLKFLYGYFKIRFSLFYLAILFSLVGLVWKTEKEFFIPHTSTLARIWIEDNIPSGSKILLDTFGPQIQPGLKSIERIQSWKLSTQRKEFGYREKTSLFFELQKKASLLKDRTYDITFIPHPAAYLPQGKIFFEAWMNLERARELLDYRDKYDYIVVTSVMRRHYARDKFLPPQFEFIREFYTSLDKKCVLVKEFREDGITSIGTDVRIYKVR